MAVAINERTFQSVNPATGKVTLRRDTAADSDIDRALADADHAYRQWSTRSIDERAEVAITASRIFERRADELARLITEEVGKPLGEAREEVEFCRDIFAYYGERGPVFAADQPLETFSGDDAVLQRRPIGALLGIMPWNFPFYQVARLAAPNLVLGNTVLIKHAESVPQCAEAIEEVLQDAGLPAGGYHNMFASHGQVETIIADPRVQGVSVTGSERAGSAVAALAGKHLKKCVLELGGSDPYIILDTDDVPAAAAEAWHTRIYNMGQACNSNKRIIVMADIYDEFVSELTKHASGLQPGDPMSLADGTYAPMSSRAAAENIAAIVEDAVSEGATLHCGGILGQAPAAYYSPAVLTGVTPQLRAYREELFGPVAVVYSVDSEESALQLANDSEYGLAGAVFSQDTNRAVRVADQIETGAANVNVPAGEGAEIPVGGVKRSGFGRELGPPGMDEFVNKRLRYVKRNPEEHRRG